MRERGREGQGVCHYDLEGKGILSSLKSNKHDTSMKWLDSSLITGAHKSLDVVLVARTAYGRVV